MGQNIDKLFDAAGRAADSAAKLTSDLVNKGKDQVELYTLQNRLSKAQKQLGALIYMLHKTEQENEPMVKHYIEEIDRIKEQMAALEKDEPPKPAATAMIQECPVCGAEVDGDVMFCRSCGAKLSDEESDD